MPYEPMVVNRGYATKNAKTAKTRNLIFTLFVKQQNVGV